MSIKTIINISKVVITAVTVIPPAVEGATIMVKGTAKFVKNRFNKSKKIKKIKRDFKCRRAGIRIVK